MVSDSPRCPAKCDEPIDDLGGSFMIVHANGHRALRVHPTNCFTVIKNLLVTALLTGQSS